MEKIQKIQNQKKVLEKKNNVKIQSFLNPSKHEDSLKIQGKKIEIFRPWKKFLNISLLLVLRIFSKYALFSSLEKS